MIHNQLTRQIFALSVTLGLSLQLVTPAFTADDFGANWQAKPLVDYNQKPSTASQPNATANAKPAPPTADQAALEAKLKPAEPFIASVEKQLTLTPQAGDSLINRLNTLQSVLYGGQKYQDAGELLAQLATLFPEEAAKAQANLNAKLQNSLPPATASQKPTTTGPKTASIAPQPGYPSAGSGTTRTIRPQPKNKKHFWSNDDDPFKNDPFFQDHPSSYQSQQQPSGPSTLGAIGKGLAGLAMMAGAVAGSYYMNKNSGGLYPNNGYYNNPGYGYGGNYGYPYGYGGVRGYAPYGYGGYGNAYGSPYYGSPFGGMSVTTQPYQRYGTSTTGISPLGVPTGLYPY